jgi:hypothetical protein
LIDFADEAGPTSATVNRDAPFLARKTAHYATPEAERLSGGSGPI